MFRGARALFAVFWVALVVLGTTPAPAFGTEHHTVREALHDVRVDRAVDGADDSGSTHPMSPLAPVWMILLPATVAGVMILVRRRVFVDEHFVGLADGEFPTPGQAVRIERGNTEGMQVRSDPPDGVPPGLMGLLLEGRSQDRHVAATVVDLAVRGHLVLEEVDSGWEPGSREFTDGLPDWILHRTLPQDPQDRLLRYEQTVLDGLFAAGPSARFSDYRKQLHPVVQLARKEMDVEATRRGWFRLSPRQGMFRIGGVGIGFVLVSPFTTLLFPGRLDAALGLTICGAVVLALGRPWCARSATGSVVLARSRGYARHLAQTDASQFRAPALAPVFSRGVPYAMVVDSAERWGQTFHWSLRRAQQQRIPVPAPTWYVGRGVRDFATVADGVNAMARSWVLRSHGPPSNYIPSSD